VTDVLRGSTAVFVRALMNAPGKEKEKERTLNTPLAELLGADGGAGDEQPDQYADLTIACALKGDETLTSIEGVPPLRVSLA